MDGPPLSEDSWPDTQVDCVPRLDLDLDALCQHLTITDPKAELRPGGVRAAATRRVAPLVLPRREILPQPVCQGWQPIVEVTLGPDGKALAVIGEHGEDDRFAGRIMSDEPEPRGPVTELSRWGPGARRRHAATSEQRPGEDRRSPSRTGMRLTLPVAP